MGFIRLYLNSWDLVNHYRFNTFLDGRCDRFHELQELSLVQCSGRADPGTNINPEWMNCANCLSHISWTQASGKKNRYRRLRNDSGAEGPVMHASAVELMQQILTRVMVCLLPLQVNSKIENLILPPGRKLAQDSLPDRI